MSIVHIVQTPDMTLQICQFVKVSKVQKLKIATYVRMLCIYLTLTSCIKFQEVIQLHKQFLRNEKLETKPLSFFNTSLKIDAVFSKTYLDVVLTIKAAENDNIREVTI